MFFCNYQVFNFIITKISSFIPMSNYFQNIFSYRVFRYLSPPMPSTTGCCHTLNLYIFIILYQFQIYIQVFGAISLFSYFRLRDSFIRVLRFSLSILPKFLGILPKNGYKMAHNWRGKLNRTSF